MKYQNRENAKLLTGFSQKSSLFKHFLTSEIRMSQPCAIKFDCIKIQELVKNKPLLEIAQTIDEKSLVLDGWMDESKSWVKACLQQSKIVYLYFIFSVMGLSVSVYLV